MKTKFGQLITSRTTWTLVVLLLVNVIPAVKNVFPNIAWLDTVNTLLVVVAGYFHINPSSVYAPAGSIVTQETPNTVSVTTPQ